MATVDVKLTTKFIEVGINPESFYTTYGYNSFTSDTVGDCNEIANGSTDTTLPYVYSSGTENITRCFWLNSSGTDTTYLYLDTTNNARWSKFRIGSFSGQQTFNRTDATFADLGSEGRWSWNTFVNSFGTTAGNDIPLVLFATIEDGLTSTTLPPTSITASDTNNRSFQINSGGGAVNQKYRVIKVSGTTGANVPDGGSCGTAQYTGQAVSITLDQNELPAAGSTVNYKVETSVNSMGNNVFEDGFWADCTGTGSTFSVTRDNPTPSGSISFAGASFATEGSSGIEFIFDNTVDGTYYYDVNRISGSVSGGEVVNPGPSPITVSSGSARVTVTFVNDNTTEIGFQGEEFVMRYGTTSNSQDLDTLNFTLYDDDSGISYTSSTVNINGAATSHQISVVRAAGDSSTSVSAYIAVSPGFTPLSTNLSGGSGNDFILGTGTTVITVNDVPGAGSSETYYVRIDNGQQFINGPTYTVNQAAAPTAPTSITFEADQNVADQSILQAVTIAGGSTGTIQYSEDNTNWTNYTGPTDFLFVRNIPKTIYARRNDGGALSSVSQSSKTYGYFTGDPSAVGTPAETSISANDLTGVGIVITGGSANTRYRVVNTSVSPTFGIGNTGDGNGTVTATGNTQDLPGKGQTDNYKIQYKVITGRGGDDTWRDVNPPSTSTITRTTDIPNSFTLDTRTNQATSAEVVDSVQITGLTQESIVRRTGGTGTFAVGTSTQPSAGSFSTADKTITNNQYLWVKDTTSANNSTAKSTTISIGTQTLSTTNNFSPAPESSTFSYTTGAGGGVTLNLEFDVETDTWNVTFSPAVSGQNGLSTGQAYEISAGTDVVFQNVSSFPAFEDIQISGLAYFTNNFNFSISPGSSVTRTWDTGNTGNTVDEITAIYYTQVSDAETIYLKEPPVLPDTDVTPVNTSMAFNAGTVNVTVNDVTSGDVYEVHEENDISNLGSATATGTSVTITATIGNNIGNGTGQLAVGETKTYEIFARRPSSQGGDNSLTPTDDTFTITRNTEPVTAPTDITFSPASTVSKSTNVTVDASGGTGGKAQVRLGLTSWSDAPATFNLTRGTIYSFSARQLGSQGASVAGPYVESYQVPYLSPDTSVSVIVTTTIAANAGNQTVRVQNGNSLDTYSLTSLDGNTTYDSITGNGNMTLTAASPDELPASGSNQSYRIRAQRPIDSGGNNSPVNTTGTNNNFTITRSDPTQPTVTIDADPGTRSKSVSLGVDASGGTGSTFEVSEDNSNFVASGTAFEFTRGVNKTVYGRGVTDSNPGASNTASRELGFIAPFTPPGFNLSTSSITAGATANVTVNISGATIGDVVEVRTDDTNTPLASGASVGSDTIDAFGLASITISSGEQPDVQNTTARYRLFVKNPTATGGNNTFVDTGKTASISRGGLTAPNAPVIPNDTTTRSQSVSLTVTVTGGSGGSLQLSEDNTTWFTGSSRAFEFTRNVEKTIYARRLDGSVASNAPPASRKLEYIDPDTDVDPALSASSISPGSTAQITASVRNVTIGERLRILTTNANTQNGGIGFNVGSASARTSTTVAIALTNSLNELPSFSTGQVVASYKLQARKFLYDGGSNAWFDTGDTFSITRRAFTAPNSIQFPSDPGTLSDLISLTVDIAGGAEGSLQISEDNTNWTTGTSGSFQFTRNVPKTIYARRIDGSQTSSVTSSSFTLGYLPPNSSAGVSPSTTSITAGFGGTVTVAITGATSQDFYRIVTTDTNTPQASGHVVDSFTGTTASSFTIANNELPDVLNTSAGYRVEVLRPFGSGGDEEYDTVDTFSISRGTISQPTSIQFPSDPGTLSDSVSLTVDIAGGSGGSLQISENNSTWFTQASRAFEFTRNVPKTIYARRNDSGTVSGVTQSSFTLSYLAPNTTIGITPSATSVTAGYGGTVTVAITGATSQDIYRIVTTDTNTPQASGYVVDSFTGTTASSFTIANNELPDVPNTSAGYRVEALRPKSVGGDGTTQVSAGTFSIARGNLTAPTSIQFPSDPGTASKSVSLTVTIGGGSGGSLQISEDNTNWFTATSRAFEFTRNVEKTIYARRNDNGTLSSVTQSSFELAFLPGDGSITPSVSESSIAYLSSTPVTVGITDGASNTQYRVVNNSTPSTVYGNTITGNGTITLANPGDLPTAGANITYRLQFARTQASGGSGSFATATPATFTISRSAQDITPNAFNFTDTTNASRSSFQFSTVQITGLNDTATVSVTQNNGAGQFVVDSNATAPSSGYGTTGSITNNQYLHVRILSSDSLGGTVSSRFTVGTVFDDFKTTTTNQSADLVISISYFPGDSEPGGGIPSSLNIFSSPGGFTTDAGNTVKFQFSSVDPGVTSISLSALNIFTNNADFVINNGSNVTRTITSGTTPATTDTINVVTRGDDILNDTFNVIVTPLEPDTSVSIANATMAASASTFTLTIEEKAPNENSSVTQYLIKEGTTTLATKTGPGSVSASAFPPFLGIPVTRGLYARIPPASGGTNQQKFIQSFEVTRGSPPGGTDPLQNSYGIAIYDNTGTLVTTFAENSSIGKKIFTGTTETSTSACTEIATGLTGLSNTNCFTIITSDASDGNPEGFKALPSTIKADGSTLLLGREQYASESVEVTIIQTKGATISNTTSPDYGVEIYNENGDLIIDDLSQCFAVREIINCAGATVFGGNYALFDITLVEGRYPFSAGPPIPAIQGPGLRRLAPPYLLGGNSNYSNSYGKVRVVLPEGVSDVSNYNIAMLVDREANPVYYGGSASDYGIQVKDANGNITWDSGWRQAVINNIVSANQFTLGTNQNGTYDVTTGYDGVIAPVDGVGQAAELSLFTPSTGQTITINNLNIMDPTNTFLLGGGLVTGKVKYRQTYVDGEQGLVEPSGFYGGGTHVPAVTITSNSSVNITMLRTGDGPLPPDQTPGGAADWGTRDPNSQHPEGYYVFARIT